MFQWLGRALQHRFACTSIERGHPPGLLTLLRRWQVSSIHYAKSIESPRRGGMSSSWRRCCFGGLLIGGSVPERVFDLQRIPWQSEVVKDVSDMDGLQQLIYNISTDQTRRSNCIKQCASTTITGMLAMAEFRRKGFLHRVPPRSTESRELSTKPMRVSINHLLYVPV